MLISFGNAKARGYVVLPHDMRSIRFDGPCRSTYSVQSTERSRIVRLVGAITREAEPTSRADYEEIEMSSIEWNY